MMAPRGLRAPRSSGHPTRPRPARPMTGPQSVAEPLTRRAGPNRPSRAPKVRGARVPAALRAWEHPRPEPAGSTMTEQRRVRAARRPAVIPTTVRAPREMRLEVRSGLEAPMPVPGRRVLPRRERQLAAHPQAAAEQTVQDLPMRALAPPEARPERQKLPTLEAGPGRYPSAGRVLQASPTSARVRRKATRAHPTRPKTKPRASPAGPSLGLRAAERQLLERQMSASLWRAEPTSTQRQPSGRPVMQVAPEAPPSCACGAGGRSSDRGWRQK